MGRSFRVILALPEDAGTTLLPGAAVTVTAEVPRSVETGVTVPAAALLAENDRSAAVMILEDSGEALRVRRVPVTVQSLTGGELVVHGLPDGSEIVTAGAHRLQDGQPVRRFAPLAFAER